MMGEEKGDDDERDDDNDESTIKPFDPRASRKRPLRSHLGAILEVGLALLGHSWGSLWVSGRPLGAILGPMAQK